MMRKILFTSLFVLVFIISIAFATLNMQTVSLSVFIAQWQLPLSVLMIVMLMIGLVTGALIIALHAVVIRLENRRLHHRLEVAEQELNSLRTLPIREKP